jgi:hypothetical protein
MARVHLNTLVTTFARYLTGVSRQAAEVHPGGQITLATLRLAPPFGGGVRRREKVRSSSPA